MIYHIVTNLQFPAAAHRLKTFKNILLYENYEIDCFGILRRKILHNKIIEIRKIYLENCLRIVE